MYNIAHVNDDCQAQFNFDLLLNPDHRNYFHLLPPGELPPGSAGDVLIPTSCVPAGDLIVFARPSLFDDYPFLRDQRRKAIVVRYSYLRPGPDGLGNIAMIVITWPLPDEDPDLFPADLPGPGPAKIIELHPGSAAVKKKIRHNKPPADLVKYFAPARPSLSWQPVLKSMYKNSKRVHTSKLQHYTGLSHRWIRAYLKGNEKLAAALGVHRNTISSTLTWMKSQGMIKLRHRGYKGEGNSIWELPFNLSHSFAWLRDPFLREK